MSMHGGVIAAGKAREGSISAVITRADGTVEDLGVVAYWHRNPVKHLAMNAWIKIRRYLWR